MIIYARSVTRVPFKDRDGRTRLRTQYVDLVYEPGTPPCYGLYDPNVPGGYWIEEFGESECLRRLSVWEDWHRGAPDYSLEQITLDGFAWLTRAAGQDLSAKAEHGIYTREVPQPLFGLHPGRESKA